MNIFVIDKATKINIGVLDFIPQERERLILKNAEYENIECVVECVVYHPAQHITLIFVNVVENYYEKMIGKIKW